jgi:hypothetical protein
MFKERLSISEDYLARGIVRKPVDSVRSYPNPPLPSDDSMIK